LARITKILLFSLYLWAYNMLRNKKGTYRMRIGDFSYVFKTEPYEHQVEALEQSWQKLEYALFMEMGTGKSKVVIDNAAMLFDAGNIEGLLIIAPKGVYRNWTKPGGEIDIHMPDHIPLKVATWGKLTVAKKDEINALFSEDAASKLCIFVINIDQVMQVLGRKNEGIKAIKAFLNSRNVMTVIDESTTIKNPKAKRTKAAVKLGPLSRYRRVLTGSPVTKSPLDVYTQCEFLNPHLLGHSSYYGFRRRYAKLEPRNYGGRTFDQVTGFKNVEELQELLKDFSFRKTKAECLDLPEKIYMRREFDLTSEQRKAYKEMKEMALVILEEGEATTTSVIIQLLRLHQISCGFLSLDEEQGIKEFKNERLTQLMELLEEVDGKAIIWANYRYDIARLHGAIASEFGSESIVTYFGDTSDNDRVAAVDSFQDPGSSVRFFLGNTQTGGYGITLTEASTVIYFSNNYDLEKRLQSEDRAHRIGQNKAVTYVDLVCRDTVDEKIIDALRAKINIARAVTGDEWREWL